jgi:hypothetical protein
MKVAISRSRNCSAHMSLLVRRMNEYRYDCPIWTGACWAARGNPNVDTATGWRGGKQQVIDAIRTIEKATSAGEWAMYMNGNCTWRFSGRPSRLTEGSLIFFALHGLIQGVGEYVSTSEKKNRSGFYIVTTKNNKPLVDFSCEFVGYTQLRYLDVLPEQYDGAYISLTKKLNRYAKQYRNGTFTSNHR